MAKTIFALIGAGLALVLGVSFLASASFGVYPKKSRESTAEMMRKERLNMLAELYILTLAVNAGKFDDCYCDMRESAAKLNKRAETAAQFDFGKQFAVDLLAAKKADVYPVEILGAKYDEDRLTAQTRQLCGDSAAS